MPAHKPRFKGGSRYLNSGGLGPDPYLFRKLPHGRWTNVLIEVGPGKSAEYHADIAAMRIILSSCQRVAVGDLATLYTRNKLRIETMRASEFLERSER